MKAQKWELLQTEKKTYIATTTSNPLFSIKPESAEGGAYYAKNCYLVAAAPDMYEALKEIAEMISDMASNPNQDSLSLCNAIAEAAMMKAEGKPTLHRNK